MPITPSRKVVYHADDNVPVEMYLIDANAAVSQHPNEWKHEPWTEEEAKAARARREEKRNREVEAAKAAGQPEPPPLPPVKVEKFEGPKDRRSRVDIPSDWRDLPANQRRQIAIKLGSPQTVKAAEADDVIEAEEKRREEFDPDAEANAEPEPPKAPVVAKRASPAAPGPGEA